MSTLYWHDYETWGEVPSLDKPSQFAGIRTDEELNIIGEPLMVYCKPSSDTLPKPDACLITGISPQKALAEGLSEPEFMAAIAGELAAPGTCGVGYNSIRFDDEVSRYGFYRNFHDPYEREWKNGNSRWDLIDVVRLCCALRPQGIEWPQHEDGKPSFKLEHLSAANGLAHEAAHDALSDVYATIALAKLLKEKQPALYSYAYSLRDKRKAMELIDLQSRKPLLHISSMFPSERYCSALVMPVAMHPKNKNAVICYDLMIDPEPLLSLPVDEIIQRLYTASSELPEGTERIALKLVHLNKSPMLVTAAMVKEPEEERLQINLAQCRQNWSKINKAILQGGLLATLQSVYSHNEFTPQTDPERMLYDGFFADGDKAVMEQVRRADANQLADSRIEFQDQRLQALLFRYKARHFPSSLTAEEAEEWEAFRFSRLTEAEAGASITLEDFFERIAWWREQADLSEKQAALLDELEAYGDGLLA
ncbi:exodeoxyribonuclease I [uncultured Pseudoteredinibacter sp.]|uniref:exodeoxyribonuclease I n=1 Tax=uncultured Pseudoteredinibacter sp. TaxID=1641701 RepID=UPI0026053590|nr:exodeoxyribonuclease I [uncultured Pseudoteredinibacter sp.]